MFTPPPKDAVSWTVSSLVQAIADTFKARFSSITVRGEISSFSRASSGHCYFILKDENSQIRCAMFQRAANLLSFQPDNGDEVEIRGRIAIYEQRGDLQLIVESMKPTGQGRLLEQFQQLKNKLEGEGLFSPQRKRAIPLYPQRIGVISSLQAAALRDVLTTLHRRAPHVRVIVYPTAVQGAQAVGEIVQAIHTAGQRQEVESIILCRGGGSLEDLWCFNEEAVVRAIAACPIPIIAGIGHEIDFTLADFVSDLRAPTPTAAAELATEAQLSLLQHVQQKQNQLKKGLFYILDQYAQRLDRAALSLRHPALLVQAQKQKFLHIKNQFKVAFNAQLNRRKEAILSIEKKWPYLHKIVMQQPTKKIDHLSTHYAWAFQKQLLQKAEKLKHLETRLLALNPENVLARGYAWVTDDKGQLVTSAKQLQPEQKMITLFNDGQVEAIVTRKTLHEKNKPNKLDRLNE